MPAQRSEHTGKMDKKENRMSVVILLLTISGKLIWLGSWTFWAMDGVGVLELDRNCPIAIGQGDFLEDQGERVRLEDREVTALLSLAGGPTQEPCGAGIVSSFDGIFDIGISSRFVQLMIERCDDILPGSIKDRDAVGSSIWSSLGIDSYGIVDSLYSTRAISHMDRSMVAA